MRFLTKEAYTPILIQLDLRSIEWILYTLEKSLAQLSNPLPSMYGIFTHIWMFLMEKYGKCR